MDSLIITVLIANIGIMAGSILSHAGLWYKLGRLEKTVYNGGK